MDLVHLILFQVVSFPMRNHPRCPTILGAIKITRRLAPHSQSYLGQTWDTARASQKQAHSDFKLHQFLFVLNTWFGYIHYIGQPCRLNMANFNPWRIICPLQNTASWFGVLPPLTTPLIFYWWNFDEEQQQQSIYSKQGFPKPCLCHLAKNQGAPQIPKWYQ